MVLFTPDNYPYPAGNEWDWLKNATWKTDKAANNFLADIGERNYPGLSGYVQKLSEKGISAIATGLGAVITTLPIPGAQILGPSIIASVQTGVKSEIEKAVKKGLTELKNKYGDKYIKNVSVKVFADTQTVDTIRSKFSGLSVKSKWVVVHHIVNRWRTYRENIIAGNWSAPGMQATYQTILCALTCWYWIFQLQGQQYNKVIPGTQYTYPDKGLREFFSGENVGLTLAHLASQDIWNANNPEHVKMLTELCSAIALLEVETDEIKFNQYLNEVSTQQKQIENEVKKQNETKNKNINTASLLTAGLGLFTMVKK